MSGCEIGIWVLLDGAGAGWVLVDSTAIGKLCGIAEGIGCNEAEGAG